MHSHIEALCDVKLWDLNLNNLPDDSDIHQLTIIISTASGALRINGSLLHIILSVLLYMGNWKLLTSHLVNHRI